MPMISEGNGGSFSSCCCTELSTSIRRLDMIQSSTGLKHAVSEIWPWHELQTCDADDITRKWGKISSRCCTESSTSPSRKSEFSIRRIQVRLWNLNLASGAKLPPFLRQTICWWKLCSWQGHIVWRRQCKAAATWRAAGGLGKICWAWVASHVPILFSASVSVQSIVRQTCLVPDWWLSGSVWARIKIIQIHERLRLMPVVAILLASCSFRERLNQSKIHPVFIVLPGTEGARRRSQKILQNFSDSPCHIESLDTCIEY